MLKKIVTVGLFLAIAVVCVAAAGGGNLGTITAGSIDGVTATFGSGNEVVLNSSGLTLTNGTGTNNKVKWNDGAFIASFSGQLRVDAGDFRFDTSSAVYQVLTGALQTQNDNTADLGNSSQGWGQIYFNPTSDNDDLLPLVIEGKQIKKKGNTVSSSGCDLVDVQSGPVVGCSSAPAPELAELAALRAEVASLRAELAQMATALAHAQ